MPDNLPLPLTSLVGREAETDAILGLLEEARLLTLAGPGGAGKSRLALRAGSRARERYPDGVWLVELAPLVDAALVPQAVAGVLGARERPSEALAATLAAALRPKRALVILDNCEHLVEACARLAEGLLRSCPSLQILATSREPLGVGGEVLWRVPPLALPRAEERPSAAALAPFGAIRLFVERAAAAHPDFALTDDNAPAVAALCRRLDGLPLALELAAARVGVLSVEQLLARVEDRFRLLTGGARTALPRHQTLRAAVDWSHDLLGQPEKALLRRCAVFAGGWTLEAAEAVCAGDGVGSGDVVDLLARLAAKSLVVVEPPRPGRGGMRGTAPRYRLLETIRRYAADRLLESGEDAALRARHADWLVEAIEGIRKRGSGSPVLVEDLDRLEAEHDNVRAALAWSAGRGLEVGLRLAVAFSGYWTMRGSRSEGLRWVEAALAAAGESAPAPLRARALEVAGALAWWQREYERGVALLEESLAAWRALGDGAGIAGALHTLGRTLGFQGETERGIALLEEALALFRRVDHPTGVVMALRDLGVLHHHEGRHARGEALLDESLALGAEQAGGRTAGVALGIFFQGIGAYRQGDFGRARELLRDSLARYRDLTYDAGVVQNLEMLACVASEWGQAARAARLLGASSALETAMAYSHPPSHQPIHDRAEAMARGRLGDGAFAEAWAAGERMTVEEAIAYALSVEDEAEPAEAPRTAGPTGVAVAPPGRRARAARRPDELTERESEVAALIARGLTNREIAAALVIAERTVHAHVGNILGKLGLSSRAQVAVWVVERQPLSA